MAEKRKLLAEIEKCYKKIDEGVELFEEIMEKMQEANSDNQRDKYQDDLKKEIKKLQRLRDQVKNWQNSSDIKDKDKLIQYRKLIEQRMEQFKDVERENKTKPHSKLGLSAEEKLDPKEKAKADAMEWIQTQIRELNDEADRSEMQLESLSNADTGKKRGKKEDAKTKNERERRSEELRRHLERLKFHVEKLEVCMRMISNESLDAREVIHKLKQPIEEYIEMVGDDMDSYDPEDVYDELNLEKLCAQIGGVNLLSVDEEHKENGHDLGIDTESGAVSASRHGSGENGQPPSPAGRRVTMPLTMSSPHQVNTPPHPNEHKKLSSKESSLDRPRSPATAPPPPPPGIPYNSVAAGRSTTTPTPVSNNSVSSGIGSFSAVATPTTPSSVSSSVKNNNSLINSSNGPSEHLDEVCMVEEVKSLEINEEKENNEVEDEENEEQQTPSTISSKKDSIASKKSLNENQSSDSLNGEVSSKSSTSTLTLAAAGSLTSAAATVAQLAASGGNSVGDGSQMNDDSTLRALRLSNQNKSNTTSNEPKRAHIPAWLGASPLGRAPNTQEYDIQLAALELAVTRTQLPLDSEKPRIYLPKMIFPVPSYYAQTAPSNADSLEYYLRLSPDTLFFIFYYMEGTRAQLLAAKALKKLSWRFHTKYLTWFQRHEEPKTITDDYEQGTYVYFDFEKWSQRKKESFTFEYKFLEDKEFD